MLAVVVVVLPTEADIDAVAATAADAGGTAAADALALAVPPVIFTIGGRAAEAACAELAACGTDVFRLLFESLTEKCVKIFELLLLACSSFRVVLSDLIRESSSFMCRASSLHR